MSDSLKHTPLYSFHCDHGAKMVPFAGFAMPVQYRSIVEEHHQVRRSAGLFDVSHMGEAEFQGKDALRAVDALMTNDISKLKVGRAVYTAMCREDGGILDDLIVYRLAEDHVLVCLNASNREKDVAHMRANLIDGDVTFNDTSDSWAQIALQGPKAEEVLAPFTESDLKKITRFGVKQLSLRTDEGEVKAWVARTGYTGEDGFEIYLKNDAVTPLVQTLIAKTDSEVLSLCGLGCRDTLRMEAQFLLYGNDIDESTNPLEAGLSWVVKMTGDRQFIGRDALQAIKKEGGPSRRFTGFQLEAKGVLRSGYLLFQGDQEVGKLTSGGVAPSLGCSIGLGYVKTDIELAGGLEVLIRNKRFPVKEWKRA